MIDIKQLYKNEIKKLYEVSYMKRHLEEFIRDYIDHDEGYSFNDYIEKNHIYYNIDNLVMDFKDTNLLHILNDMYQNDTDMLKHLEELNALYQQIDTFDCEGELDGHIDYIGEQTFIMSQIVFKDILEIAQADFEIIKEYVLLNPSDDDD